MRKTLLAVAAVLLSPIPVNATLIDIETDTMIVSQSSYTFGDYILELTAPANTQFNLINADSFGSEDFIVSNADYAGDFTLRRLDNLVFSLLGIRHAGQGTTTIGGVGVAEAGSAFEFDDFSFSGQAGVTDVTSILFSPSRSGRIQLSAFDVVSEADSSGPLLSQLSILDAVSIPEPGTLGLMLGGLLVVFGKRRRGRL